MKWNELLTVCKEKLTITEDELNKLYKTTSDELKTMGVAENKLEDYTVARIHAHLKRQLSVPAEKFTGIVLGATRITDYGAKKLYDSAMALYKVSPEQALQQGVVNSEGVPIHATPEWKKGQEIDLTKKSRTLIMLVKGKDDTEFVKSTLNLRDERIDKGKVPFFQLLNFRANKSNKSTPDNLLLNDSVVTEFTPVENAKQITSEDAINYLKKHFKDKLVKLTELSEWHDANLGDQNRMVIVKGNVSRVNVTKTEALSNTVDLVDIDFGFDTEGNLQPPVTCWLSKKDFDIDFNEGALDVIVIGKTNKGKVDGKLSLEAYGIFVDNIFKIQNKPQPLKEEVIEESGEESEEEW
jgi:hypothetical protein